MKYHVRGELYVILRMIGLYIFLTINATSNSNEISLAIMRQLFLVEVHDYLREWNIAHRNRRVQYT